MNNFNKSLVYKFWWFILSLHLCVSKQSQPDACEKDGISGTCVPLPACAQYVALLKDSATTLEGLSVTRRRRCGFEGDNAKVCCPASPVTEKTPDVDERKDESPDDFVDEFPRPGDCGMLPLKATGFGPIRTSLRETSPPPWLASTPAPLWQWPPRTFSTLPSPPSTQPLPSSPLQPSPSTQPLPSSPLQPSPSTPSLPSSLMPASLSSFNPSLTPPGAASYNGRPVQSRGYLQQGEPNQPQLPPFAAWNGKPVRSRDMVKWMALLGYKDAAVFWQCGGSIITARHVLTAAHCIKRNLYVVRLGELDLSKEEQDYSPVDFLVKKAIPHEAYTKYHNDIAVLVLDGTIDFKKLQYLTPICLPLPNTDYLSLPESFITGWGETEKIGERPTKLLYAPIAPLERDHCVRAYSKLNVTIDERVLCAGDAAGEHDACNGDSGGPLVQYNVVDDQKGSLLTYHFQLGIVSYGFKCRARRFAGLYTNVSHFMPWIEEKVLGRTSLTN